MVAEPVVVDGVAFLSGSLNQVFAVDATNGNLLWSYDPQTRLDASFASSYGARMSRGVAVWNGSVFGGDGRLSSDRARCGDRREALGGAGLQHGRGPWGCGAGGTAGRRGQGLRRSRGLRLRDPQRTRRVRRRDGGRGVALLDGTGRPGEGLRDPGARAGGEDLGPGLGSQRGRGGVGRHPLRPRHRQRLLRDGEHHAAERGVARARATTSSRTASWRSTRRRGPIGGTTRPFLRTRGTTTPPCRSSSRTSRSGGRSRRVVMQAPKNGFFYVLDARTGELLGADPFVKVTWASHVGHGERAPGRGAGGALLRERATRAAGSGGAERHGGTQLAADELQPADGPRLRPGNRHDGHVLDRGNLRRAHGDARLRVRGGDPAWGGEARRVGSRGAQRALERRSRAPVQRRRALDRGRRPLPGDGAAASSRHVAPTPGSCSGRSAPARRSTRGP